MLDQTIPQNPSNVNLALQPIEVVAETKTDLPIDLLLALGLSDSEIVTYQVIKSFALNKNCIWPTHETIAQKRGISVRTLSRHKAALVGVGLIVMRNRWRSNLSTLIIIKDISQPHANPVISEPENAKSGNCDKNDFLENDKNGLMNLKALKHDDDDGTSQFFVTNGVSLNYDFTTTTTWGNFEVSQVPSPLLETIMAKDDEIEPMVIIQATPLGREETVDPAPPIQASPATVEPPPPPDMVAKQALLAKLPLNPGPIRQKLLDVLPKLPVEYVQKCVQFYETEIELSKSNYHNPLGFMISCVLDPAQPVPANTTVKAEKEKATASATANKRPTQAKSAKKQPMVTRNYTYNPAVSGK